MDLKVPEGLRRVMMQLSPAIAELHKHTNTPRIAFAIKLGALCVALFMTYTIFADASTERIDYKQAITSAVKGKKPVFIHNTLINEIDGPFDNRTIVDLCAKTQWVPGLIFKCEAPEGGVGNVRNIFLNCIRYTIEAGASGFVVPEMYALTSGSKSSLVPFGHFFDLAHFTSSLSAACPQIQIYSHINDLYDMPSTSPAVKITPTTSLNHTALIDKHILANPGNWSLAFSQHLNYTHPTPPSAAKPILISLQKPLLEFPLSYDDRHFVPQFGRLIRFREDTRRIAAAVLYAMSQKHNLELAYTSENPILPGTFYGAHLRTGADATAAGWTPYAIQSANYLSEAMSLSLPVMYVASGNLQDLARLAETNHNISIETKESLLSAPPAADTPPGPAKGFENEWRELQMLNWDQQLLVDYEVLLRSSAFGGTWESSFSWNIAMRRHVVVGGGAWRVITKRDQTLPQRRSASRAVEVEGDDNDSDDVHHPVSKGSALTTPFKNTEWRYNPQTHQSWRRSLDTLLGLGKRDVPPPKSMLPPEKSALEAAEVDAEGIKTKEKLKEGEKTKGPGKSLKVGEKTFSDALSVVFGPVGVGRRITGSMWP